MVKLQWTYVSCYFVDRVEFGMVLGILRLWLDLQSVMQAPRDEHLHRSNGNSTLAMTCKGTHLVHKPFLQEKVSEK